MSETVVDQQDFSPELEEQPLPYISEAVLKVHSRCNLDCDYCYVYNLGNDSWREQPKIMTSRTVSAFADRLSDYLDRGDERPISFQVTYHGGEPLLAPPEFFEDTTRTLREAAGSKTVLQFAVQTNGTLIDNDYLKVFRRNAIRVGVSLDGSQEANDRHRVDRRGNSSYAAATEGIRRMTTDARYNMLFSGILAVVDIENDPVETYKTLRELNPPSLDFLLPHGNWSTPPPGLDTPEGRRDTPYADWLGRIFDVWFPDDAKYIRIRSFDSVMYLLSGGRSKVESIGDGNSQAGLVVVETNGSYELVDTLKSAPGNVAKTGLNIHRNSLQEANEYMHNKAIKLGATVLSDTCEQCPVLKQCGGGYAPHRYSDENGFINPSVFCQDLARSTMHIRGRLIEEAFMAKHSKYVTLPVVDRAL